MAFMETVTVITAGVIVAGMAASIALALIRRR
jgi:hypothetical protein